MDLSEKKKKKSQPPKGKQYVVQFLEVERGWLSGAGEDRAVTWALSVLQEEEVFG